MNHSINSWRECTLELSKRVSLTSSPNDGDPDSSLTATSLARTTRASPRLRLGSGWPYKAAKLVAPFPAAPRRTLLDLCRHKIKSPTQAQTPIAPIQCAYSIPNAHTKWQTYPGGQLRDPPGWGGGEGRRVRRRARRAERGNVAGRGALRIAEREWIDGMPRRCARPP